MYSTPTKLKRQEPVFKTPMTYSPRIVGSNGKPMPSPSRTELWRQQLGLEDLQSFGGSTSSSESDEETTSSSGNANISLVEYRVLQRELDERNSQRDELLFKIKSLTDKNKRYKSCLEKEEATKRQQMKILCKTQETQLKEKDSLIADLQALVEDLEEQLKGTAKVKPLGDHNSTYTPSKSATKLIEEVKRLQGEKISLTRKLELAETAIPTTEADKSVTALEQLVTNLKQENSELREAMDRVHKQQTQPADTGPCHTDTEKQVEKLQLENARLQDELSDLRHAHSQSADMFQQGRQQYDKLDDEMKKAKQKIKSLETEISKRSQEMLSIQTQNREEQTALRSENQTTSRKLRELQAELIALQAKEPEVVTKIKKVEVKVDSEELKKSYARCCSEKSELETEVRRLQSEVTQIKADLHKTQQEKREKEEAMHRLEQEAEAVAHQLTAEIEDVRQEKEEAVKSVKRDMEQCMHGLKQKYRNMCNSLQKLQSLLKDLVQSYITLDKQAKRFPTLIKEAVAQVQRETSKAISGVTEYNKELVKKYHREMHLRKKYHNELVELKGNIRVFCRVRPKIREDGSGATSEIIVNYDRDDDGLIHVNNKGRTQTFELDRVFTESSTQTQVFGEVKSLVTSCIDGFNVCIFAYGQTGSGKTYTMEGPADDPGINQRALSELFRETTERGCDWSYSIVVSVMEIYNEMIRDLLSEDPSYKLDVKMNTDGSLFVPGLSYVEVKSVNDVNKVFAIGQKNRATATTNMNEHSSRSHALLRVTVTGVNKTTNIKTTGKLNLVDLAGSERVSKSGADGTRLKEAQSINKSLSCLGDVIHALRSRQSHVPYRNSKLTYLLQDSLGGDSKTLMIVQVAPVEKNLGESVCSLNFAQRVRMVELGQASRKVENGDTEGEHLLNSPAKSMTPSRSGGTPSRNANLTPAGQSKLGTPSAAPRNTPSGPRTPGRITRLNSKFNL